MTTSPAQARRQLVLDALSDTPQTTEELAERLSINYHTVYKTLKALQDDGLVHYTGQVKNKSFIYATGANRGIPEFYDPAGNRHIAADDIATAYETGATPASVKAAQLFFETVGQLVSMAVGLASDDTATSVTDKDLQRIRMNCIVQQSYLQNLVGYYAQMLASDAFWSVEKLGAVGLKIQEKRRSAASSETNLEA